MICCYGFCNEAIGGTTSVLFYFIAHVDIIVMIKSNETKHVCNVNISAKVFKLSKTSVTSM